MSTNPRPVWLITGCSQGIGLALTRHALSRGHIVTATSRNPAKTPELVSEVEAAGGHWLALDTTADNLEAVVQQAEALHGRLDVVVNNAGMAMLGSMEEVPVAKYREQMEVNFIGPVRVMRAVVPGMRKRGGGCIINVSSAAGVISVAGNGVYSASKFALEAAGEALSREVEGWGIRVAQMVLGAFKTSFGSEGNAAVVWPKGVYGGEHVVNQRLQHVGKLAQIAKGDPHKAAVLMFEVATGRESVRKADGGRFLRFVVGEDSWNAAYSKIEEMRGTWDAQREYAKSTAVDE